MSNCPNGATRHPRATGPCDCAACYHDRRATALQQAGDAAGAERHYITARAQQAAERERNAEHAKRPWWRR